MGNGAATMVLSIAAWARRATRRLWSRSLIRTRQRPHVVDLEVSAVVHKRHLLYGPELLQSDQVDGALIGERVGFALLVVVADQRQRGGQTPVHDHVPDPALPQGVQDRAVEPGFEEYR